jgi:hypothetical protein
VIGDAVNLCGTLKWDSSAFGTELLKTHEFEIDLETSASGTESGAIGLGHWEHGKTFVPLAVVGYRFRDTNSSYLSLYQCYLDSQGLHYAVRNNGTSKFTGRLSVTVLFVRTS